MSRLQKLSLKKKLLFFKTLGKGLKMIERTITDLRKTNKNVLPGKVSL